MTRILTISVPSHDAAGKSRTVRASDKLTETTGKICSMLKSIVQRDTRIRTKLRAIDSLTRPTAEVQAVRDRAAFDQEWSDRGERERRQIQATQAAADQFYRRTTR
ncbi:hypothetical protein MKK84_27900 [Methylobacterium sp. E-065]|uniref:hypothetical protein n=1 Tax=Methylobacterium sp. E-065 TaxID=2836583 RepID=UPI001FBC0084|nr:hypothetical protein [Methylobacterium sp. E-065]MCJ2021195.1 hypothetical protein [Methylobacterium sp. E-065]